MNANYLDTFLSNIKDYFKYLGYTDIEVLPLSFTSKIFRLKKNEKYYFAKVASLFRKEHLIQEDIFYLTFYPELASLDFGALRNLGCLYFVKPWIDHNALHKVTGTTLEVFWHNKHEEIINRLGKELAFIHSKRHNDDYFGFMNNKELRSSTWYHFLLKLQDSLLTSLGAKDPFFIEIAPLVKKFTLENKKYLETIHQPHFVHGDLNIGNILVDLTDDKMEKFYLVDFERSFWGDSAWDFVVWRLIGKKHGYHTYDEELMKSYVKCGGRINKYHEYNQQVYEVLWSLFFCSCGYSLFLPDMVEFGRDHIKTILK